MKCLDNQCLHLHHPTMDYSWILGYRAQFDLNIISKWAEKKSIKKNSGISTLLALLIKINFDYIDKSYSIVLYSFQAY